MSVRKSTYPVLDLILTRWSRRAMSGEPITHEELMSLFEAARWAPSSFNHQPWRFIYAERNTPEWELFYNLQAQFNQSWSKNSAVFILALSHKYFEYNNSFSRTHSLDTGAATENLALQGFSMGLVVHGIEGFDYERARTELGIPDDYDIEAMYIVGKPGRLDVLSTELQKREVPSDRLPTQELLFKGRFGKKA